MDHKDLSKDDLLKMMDLISKCLDTDNDQSETDNIFQLLRELIPFDQAVGFMGESDGSQFGPIEKVFNHGYDSNWLTMYQKKNFEKIDPIMQYSLLTPAKSFEWTEAYANAQGSGHNDFLDMASDFSLKNGLAILLRGRTQKGSMNTGISLHIDEEVPEHCKTILDYIAPHLQTIFEKPSKKEIPSLTKKEHETLYWVKEGKSSWDIGMILGVSERTIKFHLSNIFKKLEVVNRSQAVAKALQLGLISM